MPAAPLDVPPVGLGGMPCVNDDRLNNELPTIEEQPWPPTRFSPIHFDYRVWDAWWTGDPDKLMRAYYSICANSSIGRQYFATTGEAGISAVRPGQYQGGLIGSIRRGSGGRPTPPGENRTHYHMPLPGDLSSASASLLLAQPPQLTDDDSSVDEKPEGGRIRRRAVAMKPVTHRGTGQRHLRISVLTLSLQHRRHRRSRRCMQLAQGRREPGYRVLNWISHLRRPRPAFRPGRTPESNCTPVTCTRTFRQSGPHRRKPAGPVGSPPRATRTTGWRKAGGDR